MPPTSPITFQVSASLSLPPGSLAGLAVAAMLPGLALE